MSALGKTRRNLEQARRSGNAAKIKKAYALYRKVKKAPKKKR